MSTPTITRPTIPLATAPPRRPGVLQKSLAAFTVLIGLTFIAMTLIVNLFSVGPAFERLTDGFRPVMTQQSIASAREHVAQLGATGTEIQTKVFPALAQQLKMTPAQMNSLMESGFPATTAGLKALPIVVPNFNNLLTTLDQQRPYFASADAIPTKNLPATTLPWALLVAGIGVAAIGVYMWFAPRPAAIVAVVVGAVLVAVPLMFSMPQKASDADQLNSNLKPVYTQSLITQSSTALTTLGAMGTQMQTQMLPALATQLKMTPAQLNGMFAQQFPNTAAALTDMPATMKQFQGLVATFRSHLSDYNTLKPVALLPIVWVMIGGGIALLLVGGAGVWFTRRTTEVVA